MSIATRNLALIIGLTWVPLSAAAAQSDTTVASAQALLGQQQWDEAAALLKAIVVREPENGRAWSLLGYALHAQGDYEAAIPIHLKAAEFPGAAPNAMYNAGMAYARLGMTNEAFEWLNKAKATNKVDMTQIGIDLDGESLRSDPRYSEVFPSDNEFADPFVEDVRTRSGRMYVVSGR